MSQETHPLLPQSNRLPHEHPIFLRVCHSPWKAINQKGLLTFRFFIASYLTAIFGIALDYDINVADQGGRFPFLAGTVSLATQIAFYWVSCSWTYQHLFSPRGRSASDSDEPRDLRDILVDFFAVPRSTEFDGTNRLAFSIFYSAATTFPFVVSFIHWFDLNGKRGEAFGSGPIYGWVHFSTFGINSIIALIEIMVLSSVRKQKPFASHVVALLSIVGLYFAWAEFGSFLNGIYVYEQLNPEYNGAKGVVMTIGATMAITLAGFVINQGLHDLRDYWAAKADCDRRNP